jgi:hypothetical protein
MGLDVPRKRCLSISTTSAIRTWDREVEKLEVSHDGTRASNVGEAHGKVLLSSQIARSTQLLDRSRKEKLRHRPIGLSVLAFDRRQRSPDI